ncbi:MAG: hypothetical protein LBP24_02805 [Coriobacteriales bacterium]|jgi:hypothetical protein|nr:hypothetical protein [Coriobacteriales bacterium]
MQNIESKDYYQARSKKIPGRNYGAVVKAARRDYNKIVSRTRRNPYIRSSYFNKEKIFLSLFWQHVMEKHRGERKRRLQLFNCAVELLENTHVAPFTRPNPNGRNELVHRFTGITGDGDMFYVQVKEELKTKRKYLISVFPKK